MPACDEVAFECGRGFARFSYVDAKSDARFSFFGELTAECSQALRIGPKASRSNCFADWP